MEKLFWTRTMPYLIDGHNLIPKIPGIQLNDLEDECALFILLDNHFKKIRKKAIVFFDRAAHGFSSISNTAFLQAHFIHEPSTADEAIISHLIELGGDARNYKIVTSDHWVADNARALGASVISSEDFARMLSMDHIKTSEKQKINTSDDVDFWLDKFKNIS